MTTPVIPRRLEIARMLDHGEWFDALPEAERMCVPKSWGKMNDQERCEVRWQMDYGLDLRSVEQIADNEGGTPLTFEPIGEDVIVLARELLAIKQRLSLSGLPENLPAKECGCEFFGKDPIAHDWLLGLEAMSPAKAAQLVVDLIADEDIGSGDFECLLPDADDFGRFVAQHNWSSPTTMWRLGSSVDFAMNMAVGPRNKRVKEHHEAMRVPA